MEGIAEAATPSDLGPSRTPFRRAIPQGPVIPQGPAMPIG
jgi:hypothetical protein